MVGFVSSAVAMVISILHTESGRTSVASALGISFIYFFTIAATQPPLYGAEIVTTPPPFIDFFIRR